MDSSTWEQLAAEFKRLRPSIRANRIRNHPDIYPCWNLGGASWTDIEDFRRLAAIAARFHGSASTTADDEVEAWLNFLVANHSKCFEDDTRPEVSIFPPWVRKEHINQVSSASAEYCERLAAKIRLDALESRATPRSNDFLRLPPGFDSQDPVDENPFPEGDENLQVSSGSDSGGADRRLEIDAFLRRCRQETPRSPNRKHIWQTAGHKTARQFQFWQASDPKATAQDHQNFHRILAMSPADFVALLEKKGII